MSKILQTIGLTKSFPGVLANDRVDLEIEEGEIHGLLGENGAGKSVLMSTIYGLYRPDKGKILIRGKEVVIDSPHTAIQHGIGMVHQNLTLVPSFRVWENIILGKEIKKGLFLDEKKVLRQLEELLKVANLEIDLRAKTEELSLGSQQRIEILKILYRGAETLIFDEPTTVLTPQEVDQLITTFRSLKKEGKTIIFISHKLKEVFAVCDRVTVLRKGKKIGTLPIGEATPEKLAEMMVGRKVLFSFPRGKKPGKEIILKLEDITTSEEKGKVALQNINFTLHAGEILGIAGVEGNGQRELAELLVGLIKARKGKIFFREEDITSLSPKERIKRGIAHIPEDRLRRGAIADFTVWENLIIGFEDQPPFVKGKLTFNHSFLKQFSSQKVKEFEIDTPGDDALLKNLSGGNQQRVVLARELSGNVFLLIASQPTRGLDIAATEYLRNKLLELKNQDKGIVLISADLDEVRSLSDRVLVLYEGKIMGELSPESDEYQFGLLMGGKNGNGGSI
ncbi:MAG: ral nucleoside transport system ATP-binding protein [Candidatus Atribacteria bacterium]|nr:ral nucleoside transport system ATP-binding protein [Candidatus Atribacteria bacterium]